MRYYQQCQGRKIRRGEYVEISELLKYNVEVDRKRRQTAGENSQRLKPSRRNILEISSCRYCYSLYAAIVGSKYLKKCRELWEYQAMTISENHKCGMGEGGSWELLYMIDSVFYQQIVSLEATILKDQIVLYFTTFLAYGKFILGASNWSTHSRFVPATQTGHCQ